MGNNCVGGSGSFSKGFLQAVLNSNCWPGTEDKCSLIESEIRSEATLKNSIINHPPEQVKIVKDEAKPTEDEQIRQKFSEKGSHEEEITVQEQEKPEKPAIVKKQGFQVLPTKTGKLREHYYLGKKLGDGQFGTTFLCVEKTTGKKYACKSISKKRLPAKEDIEDVRREIEIMHHLAGNSNIVAIKGAYEDSFAVHLVMELCKGGELFDRIIQKRHYTEKKAAQLARTIIGVIESCHSLGVMHRDLKPENFLFVNDDEDSPLKAIDFGLSTMFKPGETFHDLVGSPYYIAPEVLRKNYGPEADVWSAGVMIYILLCGIPPFFAAKEEDIFAAVLNGDLDFSSDPWPFISSSAKDLIKKMLVKDPKKRPTAHAILHHPWLQIDGGAPDDPLDSAILTRLKQFSVMNKLKKMAFKIIAESLCEEEIAGLKKTFKMIDKDNSGQITFQELKDGLARLGANLPETEIHDLMIAADIDNNGTIDYGEFIAATLHLNKIEKEDHLHTAFSYFDKDGSGFITQDELEVACEEFGIQNVQLEELIREFDQNNDGRIDYKEFVDMMQKGNSGFQRETPLTLSSNFSIGFRKAQPLALPVC